jgi:hypothetical protein
MAISWRTGGYLALGAAAITVAAYAEPAEFSAAPAGEGAVLSIRWPEADGRSPPQVRAEIVEGVLVIRFASPVEGDVSAFVSGAPQAVAFARRSADGEQVRVALRRPMTANVSNADGAVLVSLTPASTPAEVAAPDPVRLIVSRREDFTRLSFRWPAGSAGVSVTERSENRVELRFSRPGDIDIAELRTSPPPFVRTAQLLSREGGDLRIMLTLEPGVRRRQFTDGGRVVVDLLPPDPEAAAAQSEAPEATAAVAPLPPTAIPAGAVRVRLTEQDSQTRLEFPFSQPVAAAVFQRGGAVWVLFEGGTQVDLAGVQRAGRRHRDVAPIIQNGVAGVRVPVLDGVSPAVALEGTTWVVNLGPRGQGASPLAVLERENTVRGTGRITAGFGRDGVVREIEDPAAGDRLAVGFLAGPIIGVGERRSTVEAALLPARHGAVVEMRSDGVTAAFESGVLTVTRGAGMVAGAEGSGEGAGGGVNLPGAMDPDAFERLQLLQARAAAEGVEQGASVTARLALAEFLLENELAAEALGALALAVINQPQLDADPAFRLMRASANVMMGRLEEAQIDLAAASIQDDAHVALWRGYAHAEAEQWADARRDLAAGLPALGDLPPDWRARMRLAQAQAELALDDAVSAAQSARAAIAEAATAAVRDEATVVLAQAMLATGQREAALAALDRASSNPQEEVAVRAALVAINARRAAGELSAQAAAAQLEGLRFRWRGDGLELDIAAALGTAYAELGQWREALSVMRASADRFAALPSARRLRETMAGAFVRLFLEGAADAMEPIQALGLFYQFRDLTPVGPDGDRMVRQLAGRLVRVDLLEQAAQLLQHQVDERLEGFARSEIAADLAFIYLMDRKPAEALQALNATRQANLPAPLVAERRILEARAHMDLGRQDHALEIIERDTSPEAQAIRAEAAWRQRDWERAAAELRRLAPNPGAAQPYETSARHALLRLAVALTLAGEGQAARALYRDHAAGLAGTPEALAFEVVAGTVNADGLELAQLARAVGRSDLLGDYLAEIRTRISGAPTPAPTPAPSPAPEPPRAALATGNERRA